MRHHCLHSKLAGYFAVRFSAHSVGQHIQLQRCVNRVAIFVVFSDAPEVGTRACFDMQRGLIRVTVRSYTCKGMDRMRHKSALLQESLFKELDRSLNFRLAKRF